MAAPKHDFSKNLLIKSTFWQPYSWKFKSLNTGTSGSFFYLYFVDSIQKNSSKAQLLL